MLHYTKMLISISFLFAKLKFYEILNTPFEFKFALNINFVIILNMYKAFFIRKPKTRKYFPKLGAYVMKQSANSNLRDFRNTICIFVRPYFHFQIKLHEFLIFYNFRQMNISFNHFV